MYVHAIISSAVWPGVSLCCFPMFCFKKCLESNAYFQKAIGFLLSYFVSVKKEIRFRSISICSAVLILGSPLRSLYNTRGFF